VTDLLHPVLERAAPWLEPIPGPSPGGVAARLEPEYQAVANEVAKLDSVMGGDVNWKAVTAGADGLLKGKSKDVVIAAYLAHALHVTGGLDGLATGATLLAELMDRYWDSAFPELKRIRGRANAVQWFLEKTQPALTGVSVGAADAARVAALDAATKRFAEVVRGRFADAAPGTGSLLEAVGRIRYDAERASAPPPVPSPPAAPTSQPPAPVAAPSAPAPIASAPVAALPALSGELANADQVVEFLRNTGSALASAGATLRGANTSDPFAYRVLRTGLWLHLAAEPPSEGGKCTIPPPSEDLRAQLKLLAQNQKWTALLEESESALSQSRFWLDLHRMTSQALAALGSANDRARAAVAAEVRTLLDRMPTLASLSFSDGTPFADAQTRTWLDEEVARKPAGDAAQGASSGEGEAPDPAILERISRAKKLFGGGKAREALAEFQGYVATRPSRRAQFRARLDLARACAGAGLMAIAKATYEELDRDAVAHGIDEWEPALAAECLKGLIAAARALAKDPRGVTTTLEARYQRLCRLDPAAAHEVWP
jgi:type VI secretion system protein VasJ